MFEIEQVFGSPEANQSTVMKVNTLFPSPVLQNTSIKGGLILLKLKLKNRSANPMMSFTVMYEDIRGKKSIVRREIKLPSDFVDGNEPSWSPEMQHAVVLTRYVATMKKWVTYERLEPKTLTGFEMVNGEEHSFTAWTRKIYCIAVNFSCPRSK